MLLWGVCVRAGESPLRTVDVWRCERWDEAWRLVRGVYADPVRWDRGELLGGEQSKWVAGHVRVRCQVPGGERLLAGANSGVSLMLSRRHI